MHTYIHTHTHKMDTIDQKKSEFRNYIESNGVIDSFTKVMISLYEEAEKPQNPLEFIQQHLSVDGRSLSDIEALKKENDELKAQNEELMAQVEELKAKIPSEENTEES
eukprot:m.141359 g.141359  ORF g.141359 m.141359 type:complete len:108 (+) comp13194_c6_seq1:677-1000(+)